MVLYSNPGLAKKDKPESPTVKSIMKQCDLKCFIFQVKVPSTLPVYHLLEDHLLITTSNLLSKS